jgi:hypothetical protein
VPFRKPWPPRLRFGQNPARDVDDAGSPYRRDAFRRIFRRPRLIPRCKRGPRAAASSCRRTELRSRGASLLSARQCQRRAKLCGKAVVSPVYAS